MGYTSLLLKTGKTTSLIAGDDGNLEKGAARSYTTLDTGQYSGTTNIVLNGLTDVHTNECIQDNTTGLMWCNGYSQSVGPDFGKGSIGLLPWLTNDAGEGIFTYAAAANAASLAGHTDWRIPNYFELLSIQNGETAAWQAAFTGYNAQFWTSTVTDSGVSAITFVSLYAITTGLTDKTAVNFIWTVLVRGDPTAPPVGVNTLRSLLGAGY